MKSINLLKTITFSKKRRDILFILFRGSKNLNEIKTILNVDPPEILPRIKELESCGLIYRKGDNIALTEIGKVLCYHFYKLCKTTEIFEKDLEFWMEHDLTGIPEEFLLRLYELGNYKIVKSSPESIFEPHIKFMEEIKKSKRIFGVSPIFHPDYPKVFLGLAEKGVEISIITTERVFNRIRKEYERELEKFIKMANFMICRENLKVAFTVTDRFLSLGLFYKNGFYDNHQDIFSYDESAVKWGIELFRYFEERSERIKEL